MPIANSVERNVASVLPLTADLLSAQQSMESNFRSISDRVLFIFATCDDVELHLVFCCEKSLRQLPSFFQTPGLPGRVGEETCYYFFVTIYPPPHHNLPNLVTSPPSLCD
ncbi:hypothetical protein J6590_034667 [Homalodisca vitripennis]|nr:hypothetical protein J6590_034667 [Homalodisca vitripennis]